MILFEMSHACSGHPHNSDILSDAGDHRSNRSSAAAQYTLAFLKTKLIHTIYIFIE